MASDVNGPARIVVVDDEPSITDAVSTALGYEGFDVAQVHGGRDALEVVSDLRPDLVVLDIMLPDIDGVTLLKRLRQDGVNVPVLFLTARDEPSNRVEGLVAGNWAASKTNSNRFGILTTQSSTVTRAILGSFTRLRKSMNIWVAARCGNSKAAAKPAIHVAARGRRAAAP